MKAFITVIGHDTVGVVARVSGLCCELNINIEDVTQSILQVSSRNVSRRY